MGLIGLFIVAGMFLSPDKLKEYPAYVSDSPSPSGVKALYTYLENEGDSVRRWTLSPDRLPKKGSGQLLVIIEPFSMPGQKDLNEYKDFMKQGNTVLLLKENPKGMFDVKTSRVEAEGSPAVLHDRDGHTYETAILPDFRLETGEGDTVLLKDIEGAIAYSSPIGKGQLIVSTAPQWVTNENLLEKDHLPLVLLLLEKGGVEKGIILIDEYLHGGESRETFVSLYPQWLLLLLLQLAIAALLGLWMRGKRFGGILVPREEMVRFSDERIQALSAWYVKGKQYKASLEIQSDYVRVLFQERWGIPTGKDWTELKEPLGRRMNGVSEKELRSFLSGIKSVLGKERINKQEYIWWSKKIDRFRKEVEDR